MLSEQETEEIKQKLILHIESTFPEEQKSSAINQIKTMNSEQFENFLKKNNLIKNENSETKCVFCSIISGKIKSVKIDENEKAIAILEINPISKGHTIVIPKEHGSKIQKKVLELAEKVSKNIKKKFSPKDIQISTSKLFGHEIINILPIYSDENFDSERKPAKMEDLEIISTELERKTEKISKPKTKKIKEFLWLPKRIP